MTRADPYSDLKICHKAKMVSPNGDVSPLCAKKPRKINLAKERWTLIDDCVTCKRCKRLMKARSGDAVLGGGERRAGTDNKKSCKPVRKI